jgi:SAM-dependent methyltransferase
MQLKIPAGANPYLFRAVPTTARRILDVGCNTGLLGAALKEQDPRRIVFGIERDPPAAARAAERLDRVFTLDVEAGDPPLQAGSLDCILYGDVLEHLHNPVDVLRRHRRLLAEAGLILCCLPNVGHHSVLATLLRGDFQYTDAGLLDATHLRFFTYATALKLLLDAGYSPDLLDTIRVPCPEGFAAAAGPLLQHLGLHPGRTRHYLDAYQLVLQGTPLAEVPVDAADEPLSFVACVSDEALLHANLLCSPGLRERPGHEVLLLRGCGSAAEGLNRGLELARHRLVVCLHQDVYLPAGWARCFVQQWRLAEQRFGPVGVAGVYGVTRQGAAVARAGHVVDRDRLLRGKPALPTSVETLDELLLAVPKETPLRFDPGLGFHLYGADLCLVARQRGLATVALDAVCLHNSPHVELPPVFDASARRLAARWEAQLPIATSCALIGRGGRLQRA